MDVPRVTIGAGVGKAVGQLPSFSKMEAVQGDWSVTTKRSDRK